MTDDTTPGLGTFEGAPVLSLAIELPSLAGGLREAAKVQGLEPIHADEEGMLLVKYQKGKTRFDPVKNTDGVQRVEIPTVVGLTFVEGEVFDKAIADHQAAVAAAKLEEERERDEAAGTQRVPGTEPWPTDEDDGLPDGPGALDPEDDGDLDGDPDPDPR